MVNGCSRSNQNRKLPQFDRYALERKKNVTRQTRNDDDVLCTNLCHFISLFSLFASFICRCFGQSVCVSINRRPVERVCVFLCWWEKCVFRLWIRHFWSLQCFLPFPFYSFSFLAIAFLTWPCNSIQIQRSSIVLLPHNSFWRCHCFRQQHNALILLGWCVCATASFFRFLWCTFAKLNDSKLMKIKENLPKNLVISRTCDDAKRTPEEIKNPKQKRNSNELKLLFDEIFLRSFQKWK